MSKKRTSPECNDDGQTNDGSVSVFQKDENAKRSKLISFMDTTLQDLPIELIECILVKAVFMEVMGLKLAKSERKEKAELVISRLSTVCWQWRTILESNFFRNELHRTFDAQKTIHLKMLRYYPIRNHACSLTILKDNVFVLYDNRYSRPRISTDFAIDVYDRNNITVVKDVIPLPKQRPDCMEACNVSNCVYTLQGRTYIRILRITEDDEHQFNVTPLITDVLITDVLMPTQYPTLSVAADGSLILLSKLNLLHLDIRIYNMSGTVQREIRVAMLSDIPWIFRVIPRPNGNLVLVSPRHQDQTTLGLTEIDMNATIIRQYQTSLDPVTVCNTDMYGEMLLVDRLNRIEILDSELNLIDVTGPQLTEEENIYNHNTSHFNCDRKELVAILHDSTDNYSLHYLSIFRFTEE